MTVSRNLRNITVFSLIFLIFAMPLFIQAQVNDQALKYVPDNALFCVRINNVNNSLAQLDQFISGVYPITTSTLVKGLLPGLLGSPELAGLNMDGSITMFGAILNSQGSQSSDAGNNTVDMYAILNNQGPKPSDTINIFPGILVPVSNYQEFINGIANKTPADVNGIVKLPSLQNILMTQLGNYALMTWNTNYDNLLAYKKTASQTSSLSDKLDFSEAKQATSESIWIYGNIELAAKTFGPMLTTAINGLKSSLAGMPGDVTGMDEAQLQNIMNMYVSMLDTVLKEVKTVSLSINPTQNSLNITHVINTVPGTKMAQMFSTSSAKENNLLPYIENGSMMSFAFSMNSSILTESIDLQTKMLSMLGGDAISKEMLDKMTSITKQLMDCISGNAVYTFSEDKDSNFPFKGKYLIGVKDEKKFQQLINDSSELMMNSGFLDMYKSMGMDTEFKINRSVETYKGVSIDSAKMTIKFEDSDNPQAEIIRSMYGEGIEYRWGVTNGLFAAAIGSDSAKIMHELIDQVQSGSAKQVCSETQAAMALIPGSEKADFFLTMNALRLMKMGLGSVSSILPVKIPDVDIETKSNLVITGKSDKGKMTIQLALPKEHIQEIMNAVMKIQQQMTQPPATAKL